MLIAKNANPFFSTQRSALTFSIVALFLTHLSTNVLGQFSTSSFAAPNTFSFTEDVFYPEETGSNATITVEFTPGDRSYSGSVDYSTTGGTAQAGEDYQPVSGTLVFSGPGTPIPVIRIPINKDSLGEVGKTVHISLHSTNAVLTRSNATLMLIKKAATPALRLAPGQPGYLLLSWSSAHSDFILEKSPNPSAETWESVFTPPNIRDGFYWVSDAQTEIPAFYRLRKAAQP